VRSGRVVPQIDPLTLHLGSGSVKKDKAMAEQDISNFQYADLLRVVHSDFSDAVRRAQATVLDAFGFGPDECSFSVISSGPHWRLHAYGGRDRGPTLLIVAAPIKRSYIWDITPSVSAVRYCLEHGARVYLLEWMPPGGESGDAGLDEYVGEAIRSCVTKVADEDGGVQPFLMGHSLGGTLAAIFCALEPLSTRGLVLLAAPLTFEPASSRFRDGLVSLVPSTFPENEVVAGSLLSHASAAACPQEFLWSRWKDAALSLADPPAMDIHARIERWALDEVALPGKLVNQIVQWFYRENRFCRGTLSIRGRTVGPSNLQTPTLAIVNAADEIVPLASISPFIERMPIKDTRIIEHKGEVGVGLQHLAMLAGRRVYSQVWPEIISWLQAHAPTAGGKPFGDADGTLAPD
jgi:polyhydroxyalkanoate synthase subunit PhaC